MTSKPSPEKVEQLRAALEDYAAGNVHSPGLFDVEAEKEKTTVRNRALRLLDQRARSRSELTTRLLDAELPQAIVHDVVQDLERSGLVNDTEFAYEWVRQRHARRGKSSRVLDRELQEKGIDAETRAMALEQISAADEDAMARELARKKARSVRHQPADRAEYDKVLRRVVGVLARRGFSEGASLRMAKEALNERLEELAAE